MKNYTLLSLFICFCINFSTSSQNEQNKWAIDIGSASVLYEKGSLSQIGYRYIEAAPRIGLTKYIFKEFSIAGGISTSIIENKDYVSFDGELLYSFGTASNRIFNLISIYSITGASYINKPQAVNLNFGFGSSLWITENFGLTSRVVYKYFGLPEFPRSHIYASAGFIYQLSMGSGDSKKKLIRGNRSRIWGF